MAKLEEFDDVQLDVEFTQAGSRSNLTSNENIAISFGKIAKWYEALVPTGGSSGQFLGFNSSGTAKWVANPNTDQKVKSTLLAASTAAANYYPTFVSAAGTSGVNIIESAHINHTPGTTSAVGNTRLVLGNATNEGTANNEEGLLRIYSPGTKYHTIKGAKITTDNVEHTLPTTGGTILNTGTTSFTRTLTSGTKVGTIKINGTSSDIYAPTNTDTKVTDTVGTANTYYPAGGTSTSTATGTQVFDTSLKFIGTTGSTSAVGKAQLVLGNATASGTANNKQGSIVVYGSTAYAHTIQGAPTAARTLTLPDKTGTLAVTGDIPTVNNKTLTLKGGGTAVTTFTANSSSDKSLDIVAGSNVSVTADATNSKITIASSHPTITKSTDTTSTASPAHGGTFTTVDSVTRDGNGHVTKINTKTVTLPADSNTDTKVTQSATTTTNYRPILFGAKNSTDVSTLADTITDQTYTSTKMFAKPDTGILYASGFSTSGYTNGTGAQLAQYGLYLKSYKSASLPAGGDYSYSRYALRVYDGKATDNAGMLLTMDGGGLTIVGGGESATALANLISDDQRDSNTSRTRLNVGGTLNTAFSASVEQLILSSDNNIYFLTKCNTIADRKPVVLDTDSYFYPGTTKTGSIGTSSYMWNSVYAASIYENGTSLASKYAAIGHTHTTTIAADSGTNQLTLAASTKYKLTTGGTNFIFTTPPNTTYSAGDHLTLSGTTFKVADYCKNLNSGDWNTVTTNGWYMGSECTNAPSTAWWIGHVHAHNNKYCIQELWNFDVVPPDTAKPDAMFMGHKMRWFRNSTWGPWVDVSTPTPSAKVDCDWGTVASRTTNVTRGWMAYWNGAYNGTTSNLTYCNRGAFGTIVTKSATDYSKVTSSTTNGKIKIDGTDTTVYTHPSHTSKTSGLYKITVDTLGHVSATASVAKGDIPALDYLPLAGGTMDDNSTIVIPGVDNARSSTLTCNGAQLKVSTSSNWAMGLTYYNSASTSTSVGFIGAYGTTDAFESIRFGAKHDNWWMKITGTETTITGDLVFSTVTSTTYPAKSKMISFGGSTDWGRIYYRVDASDAGRLVLDIGDDSNARIDFAYNGTTKSHIDTSGNFSGNAATSSSWATARTLTLSGQLTGSVSVKGDANMTLSGWLKKSLIYDETSDFASYAWHKFAEKTITTKNEDQTITFIVSKTWGNVPSCSGILTAHIRTGSTKVYETSQFYWQLANTNIDPENFVFVYTNTADTSCKVELWYKQTSRYDGWIFTVLKEHSRTSNNNVWTLYTSTGHGSASYTTGTASYASTIAGIKNNTSGTSSNVTGTVAIANGGTGATTRLGALKNLTNEGVGTSAQYFLTITQDWGKGGYSSVANVKTVLGLKSAAYTESSDYVPNTQAGVSDAINLLSTGSSTPSLTDYYVAQYVNGGTTTTSYHRRPISALWNAFKGLITLATTGSGNAVTDVSIANDGDHNRKITVTKGSTFSLSTHTHNYAGSSSAGGPATNVAIKRVTKDSKVFPGANKVVFEEYRNGTTYNLPSNHFYHIMSAQGSDTKYGTQLALGMTTTAAYYRSYNNQTWSAWKSIINTDTYDRNRYNASIKAGSSALVAANIIVGKDGVYKHLKSGGAFDITYPILYLNGAVDANATTTNTYDIIHFTITTTQSLSLTAYKPVYIKGTLNGTVFTPVNTTPLIQTIPTSGTTYDYIYLGQATSSTTVYLQERHPIYSCRNGRVQEITPCASMAVTSDGFVAPMIKKLYDDSTTSTNYITISDVNIDDYEFFIICVTDAPRTSWESAATQWIPAREGNHHFMISNGAAPNQTGGYIHCTDGSLFISKTGTNNKDLHFTLCRPAEAISSSGSSITTDNFPNTRIMRVYGVKAF